VQNGSAQIIARVSSQQATFSSVTAKPLNNVEEGQSARRPGTGHANRFHRYAVQRGEGGKEPMSRDAR